MLLLVFDISLVSEDENDDADELESAPSIDVPEWASYGGFVKNNTKPRRIATPDEVARVARMMKWHDLILPSGDMVPAETNREFFRVDERRSKPSRAQQRSHACLTYRRRLSRAATRQRLQG